MNNDIKLATIVKITDIKEIKDMDNIELAYVLGWQVIIKKADNLKIDDLAIYFCIDSLFDKDYERTKFLSNKPLKTRKIKGILSQGLLVPLLWLKDFNVDVKSFKDGDNVTSLMQVKKFIHCEEQKIYENVTSLMQVKKFIHCEEQKIYENGLNEYPSNIPKTGEPRIQNFKLKNFEEKSDEFIFKEKETMIITQKFDGTSCSFIYDNNFKICGRNYEIDRNDQKSYYNEINKKYDIEKNLSEYCITNNISIALQGELCGDKINANRLGFKSGERDYYIFNIYDITNSNYLDYDNIKEISDKLGLKRVKLLYFGEFNKDLLNKDKLMELAEKQIYDSGFICEGIVVKINPRRISFKVISNKYLLKYKL
jgi:hypothetical protein